MVVRRHHWIMSIPVFLVIAAGPNTFGQTAAPSMEGIQISGDYGYGLPPDISRHGYQIDQLIHIMHYFMAVLFVGWGIFFIYCLVRFRRRAGHQAGYGLIKAKPSKYAEIAVAAFEAVLLIGFSIPVWGSLKNDLPIPEEHPVEIRVIAEQFAWNFHYPGADGVFGKTAPEFVDTALNIVGKDPDDPHGEDDVVSGELHIPNDAPIICYITSKDVIHSFSVPVIRIKQDAIPGMRIPVWFRTKESAEGNYQVACAQLCGNNHYNMKALMVVESRQAFGAWLKEKSRPPEEFDEENFD